jgi:hypothetical protein
MGFFSRLSFFFALVSKYLAKMFWPNSLKVDQEYLVSSGSYLQRVKMYPHFDIAHYILMITAVREELGQNQTLFSRRHPLRFLKN